MEEEDQVEVLDHQLTISVHGHATGCVVVVAVVDTRIPNKWGGGVLWRRWYVSSLQGTTCPHSCILVDRERLQIPLIRSTTSWQMFRALQTSTTSTKTTEKWFSTKRKKKKKRNQK